MFYLFVVASTLFKLVRKVSSVVGLELDSLEAVAEKRTRDKIKSILGNPSHPLYDELWQMGSTFSYRLIPPRCKMERFRRSFVPAAIKLYKHSTTTIPTHTHTHTHTHTL